MNSKLYTQFRLLSPVLVKLYVPILIMLIIIVFASIQTNEPISKFTRDPAAIMDINPFFGVLSNIGVLFWCASAVICFFSVALVRNRAIIGELLIFFLVSGFITSVLLLDDLFLLHEEIFPRYFHVPQKVIYSGYVVTILLYLASFRKTILKTEFIFLLFAFGFFGLSITADFLPKTLLPWHHLFEDGFKLFGIMSWFGYFVRTCFQGIASTLSQRMGIIE